MDKKNVFEKVSISKIFLAYNLVTAIIIALYIYKIIVGITVFILGVNFLGIFALDEEVANSFLLSKLFIGLVVLIIGTILFIAELITAKVIFGMAYNVKLMKDKQETKASNQNRNTYQSTNYMNTSSMNNYPKQY